ncbi:ABC transporter substrate-binding protein [Cupriavidus phytorum]|uniref:ABC transporter substrate-binding protein n=2 Tax=Cupriavidus TaxID=106589 RepID=A0A375CMQ3_9BURK|nr:MULTISPECIES: tripartite tricarboxylate transporter substrate binding protein [Cupriavidus]PZX26138.1 tripartite-type tricarboxylate transporter receptor subunit TctC [Cupriavidus alkaliphilus]SOY76116.1 ABC transporter substrate-binding protein [Cupriavidus taiwanensis]
MNFDRRTALQRLGAAALALAAAPLARHGLAQSGYPSRPVRLVVPNPPGGVLDVLARAVADPLGKQWQRPVVVENRPGASGLIGADVVAKAPPDGHTLLMTVTAVVQTPYMYAKPPFDPLRDLAAVTQLCSTHMVLAASAAGPRTVAELVRQAREKPGKLTYGTYGKGTGSHLYMEVFGSASGAELTHVPYKGEAQIINDMLGGQIALGTLSPMTVRQHLKSGKIVPLAVAGSSRAPLLPEVPTFQELGYQGLSGPAWFGLFTTGGTPAAIVEKISADVGAIVNAPALTQRMADLGLIARTSQPAAFAALARNDQAFWSAVIRKYDIRLD